ncbi:division/cell wall cluster transcriptional repressor MraZ [Litorivicinus lipolyticus]|uniref:Transcriptional regulator MraZ n=1 Tax=Litorivicinus lipolyticus TaxID=418701 RepID=A0A5Q2QCD2_9GAMM|nr:division/cell wall cluster transcriptional repressor MraZ [Litorivicinus lipolyticus]QGG80953.1 division/cell wall cluster transcriptional repressor MraZ [Litorivicinus lipolyticus]
MFRGITQVNLDAKGRLAIPTRFRDVIEQRCAQKMVLTVDHRERCLLLYPAPDWATVESQINAMPNHTKAARRLQYMMVGHATDLDLDSAGRIMLPAVLREHARLEKRVVLMGQNSRFEIWSETLWQAKTEAYLADEDDDADADALAGFTL